MQWLSVSIEDRFLCIITDVPFQQRIQDYSHLIDPAQVLAVLQHTFNKKKVQ